jgi:hypothetical protein
MDLNTSLGQSFFTRFCPDPTVMYDLGELYAEFNAIFFNGELPVLSHQEYTDKNGEKRRKYNTLKWDGRMRTRTLGTYAPSKSPGHGTIRLSRKIAQDPVQVRSTLLHEMLHKYLDFKGTSDGILGHGPNFSAAAKQINDICRDRNVNYRVNFYDVEVTQENPYIRVKLLQTEMFYDPDLDIARKMNAVARAAFGDEFTYVQ